MLTAGYIHYCIASYIAIFTLYKAVYADVEYNISTGFMLMLNTISSQVFLLQELTLSYKVKQNVIYRLVNVIYIYIILACCGELVSYLNTITPYSENIASYCDSMLITCNTIYNDVYVISLHYS